MPPACFPLRFFHVPKAASSFAPFVWAHTCDLPLSMLQLKREESVLRDRTNLSWAQQPDNLRRCRCYMRGPGHSGRPRLFSDYHHAPLRSATEAQHAAGLFRQPLARLVSNARYDLDYSWNHSTAEQRLEAYVQRRHLRAKGAGRRGRLRRVRELRAFFVRTSATTALDACSSRRPDTPHGDARGDKGPHTRKASSVALA